MIEFTLNSVFVIFLFPFDRCRKLLESGRYDAIYVHGLGAAVDRAVNIALQLKVAQCRVAVFRFLRK